MTTTSIRQIAAKRRRRTLSKARRAFLRQKRLLASGQKNVGSTEKRKYSKFRGLNKRLVKIEAENVLLKRKIKAMTDE